MKLKTTADLSREYGTCGSYVLQVLRKAGVAPRRTTTTNSRKYRFWGHDALVAMDAWKAEREARYAPDEPAATITPEPVTAPAFTAAPEIRSDFAIQVLDGLATVSAGVQTISRSHAVDMKNLSAAFAVLLDKLSRLDTTMTQILDAVTRPTPPATNFILDGATLGKPDDAH